MFRLLALCIVKILRCILKAVACINMKACLSNYPLHQKQKWHHLQIVRTILYNRSGKDCLQGIFSSLTFCAYIMPMLFSVIS